MSNATLQAKQTENKSDASADAIANEAKAKAAKMAAQMEAETKEYLGILTASQAYSKAIVATGANVLMRLAKECGSTVNKAGRPAYAEWSRFTSALIIRSTPFAEQDRLFKLAKANVPQGQLSKEDWNKAQDKFVSGKGKASDGKASCSLRMATPVAVSIALGE